MKMKKNNLKKYSSLSYQIRATILRASYECNERTHIGGALSMVEILAVLYESYIKKNGSNKFILSKGHGFLCLLSALYCKGFISKKKLSSFQKNGSELIAHPIVDIKNGIESSNGSLGQGLSFACGIALSYQKRKKKGKIFVLVGDGECYEGSNWEAAITATELNLNNLFLIVDCNNFQNDGKINKQMNWSNLVKKWKGFGWNTIKGDGHNLQTVSNALKKIHNNKPTVFLAKTTKGKGVNFMERNNDWHHNRLTKNLYLQALKQI